MKQLQLFDIIPDRNDIRAYATYWTEKQQEAQIRLNSPPFSSLESTISNLINFLELNPRDDLYLEGELIYANIRHLGGN